MELSKKVLAAAVVGSMTLGSAGGAVTHKMTTKPQVVTVVQEAKVVPMPKSKPKVVDKPKPAKKVVAVKKEVKSSPKTNEALPRGV